ncbi:hypothetical protein CSHISOI_02282 [Colletotrichum shisoi]|uniref:Uncharacterized protein n=1 Tax=Colletotrichum shisoi TaxID=2078593 RepID=A0A5Q4C1J9_9PEZI|nr:hypothetical protein CSHISOI_02282 [Colletotrichum shisoi]
MPKSSLHTTRQRRSVSSVLLSSHQLLRHSHDSSTTIESERQVGLFRTIADSQLPTRVDPAPRLMSLAKCCNSKSDSGKRPYFPSSIHLHNFTGKVIEVRSHKILYIKASVPGQH